MASYASLPLVTSALGAVGVASTPRLGSVTKITNRDEQRREHTRVQHGGNVSTVSEYCTQWVALEQRSEIASVASGWDRSGTDEQTVGCERSCPSGVAMPSTTPGGMLSSVL